MLNRCYNVKTKPYPRYGGRGIEVDERWHKFEAFYEDMGEPNGLTLERLDNDKGYSKENCCWASVKTQQNNKRSNVNLTYQGQTQTLTQWCESLGIQRDRIYYRIAAGWSTERALSTP